MAGLDRFRVTYAVQLARACVAASGALPRHHCMQHRRVLWRGWPQGIGRIAGHGHGPRVLLRALPASGNGGMRGRAECLRVHPDAIQAMPDPGREATASRLGPGAGGAHLPDEWNAHVLLAVAHRVQGGPQLEVVELGAHGHGDLRRVPWCQLQVAQNLVQTPAPDQCQAVRNGQNHGFKPSVRDQPLVETGQDTGDPRRTVRVQHRFGVHAALP
mmetsp:Transcript_18713/g.47203  ORF Transcript_18713/g.47203 Transcript_18713/m.47203 type:complete len:215 (+) Transcript_18713:148-792(+)